MGLYRGRDAIVDDIRASVDLVEYLTSVHGAKLKPSGHGKQKGLCLFHKERTGSFVVDPSGLYHCFGCGAGGDIFRLVMETEGLTFPESIQRLAEYAGIDYEQERRGRYDSSASTRDFLKRVHDHFREWGESHDEAKEYWKKRKISPETVESWGLGYAPRGTNLARAINANDYKDNHFLYELGLVNNGHDFFQRRVMFPVRDHIGRLVGFAGRTTLSTEEMKERDVPKYLNTHESSLYRKSRILFGFDRAKQGIRREGLAVVAEGYTDAIMPHQRGIDNFVATAGTAFTKEHARLLRRITKNVLFLFDPDAAGIKAALAASALAYGVGLEPRVGLLGDKDSLVKVDPDELFRAAEDPREVYEKIPRSHLLDFYVDVMVTPESLDDKLVALDEALPLFEYEPSVSRRMLWIDALGKRLDIPARIVEQRYFEKLEAAKKTEVEHEFTDDSLNIAAYFVTSLLTRPPGEIEVIARRIPPESSVFSPELRDMYQFVLGRSDLQNRLQEQRQQLALFHSANSETVLGALQQGVRDKKLKVVPPQVVQLLRSGLRGEFEQCYDTLRGLRRAEQMEELLARIRTTQDPGLREQLHDNLEALMSAA